jgi:uncharacterized protein YbjT (DUF2867 family)
MKMRYFLVLVFLVVSAITVLSNEIAKKRIVVTGAGGRTGSLVFKKLLTSKSFYPIGVVRSESSRKSLKKIGATDEQIVVEDVTNPTNLDSVMTGAHAVILCTSAKPKIKILSLLKVFIWKIFGKTARPEFSFPSLGEPYHVDWLGARNQIDAAKKNFIQKFVFVSSMGGTQKENFLNTIGRRDGDEKSGNILLWKRKAEEHLIASGLDYTIIHPGGLTDKPGGKSKIIFGTDDSLLSRKVRSIPRDDVAEVCIQALVEPLAGKRSFDIVADPVENEGDATKDWKRFFAESGNCKY